MLVLVLYVTPPNPCSHIFTKALMSQSIVSHLNWFGAIFGTSTYKSYTRSLSSTSLFPDFVIVIIKPQSQLKGWYMNLTFTFIPIQSNLISWSKCLKDIHNCFIQAFFGLSTPKVLATSSLLSMDLPCTCHLRQVSFILSFYWVFFPTFQKPIDLIPSMRIGSHNSCIALSITSPHKA